MKAQVITRVVSRIASSNNQLLALFGFQPGGVAVAPRFGHRHGSYDIFNNTRQSTPGTAPGEPAVNIRRQKVGNVQYVIPRSFSKIPIPAEEVHNLRPIGGPTSQFDEGGLTHIRAQLRYLGQRIGNFRTVLTQGMLRGSLYGHQSGNYLYWDHTSAGADITIDFKVPAGNLGRLNMLGAGNIIDTLWDNPTANIPLQLTNINAAFQQLQGTGLAMVATTSKVWNNVINNDYVATQAGIANSPFTQYEQRLEGTTNTVTVNQFRARLACLPWLEWWITDDGVKTGDDSTDESSMTFSKHIDDNYAAFLPINGPNRDYFEMLEGSEPVSDREGAPQIVRTGLYSWQVNSSNPTATNLFALDNALPANYVPGTYAYGQVLTTP